MRILLHFLFNLFLFTSVNCDDYTDIDEVEYIVQLIKNGSYERVGACKNFYKHVCHSWTFHTGIVDFFHDARKKVNPIAKDILESPKSEIDSEELSMEKEWYAKCMDAKISNTDGYDLVRDIFHKANKFRSWHDLIVYYAKSFGENMLFDVYLNENNILSIERPDKLLTTLPKYNSFFISSIKKKNYLFEKHFPNTEQVSIKVLLEPLRNFIDSPKQEEAISKLMTVESFQKEYDKKKKVPINWLEQLNSIGLNLERSDTLLFDKTFLKKYHKILATLTHNNILINRFIHLIYLTNENIVPYWNPLQSAHQNTKLSNSCIKSMPIKNGIVEEIFKKRFKEKTTFFENVFSAVHEEYIKEIENSWLPSATKDWALNQLNNSEILSPGIYSTIKNGIPNSYEFNITQCGLQNLINFNRAQIEYKVNKYRENLTRRKRDLHLSAIKNRLHNYIETIAEHILTPLFSLKAPVAWNYGHMASAIGHDLSHALDKMRFFFHVDEMKEHYSTNVNCYTKKIRKYNIRGVTTRKENVADSVGLKIAYNALKKAMEEDERINEERLPGLEDMDAEKLFFTAFATMFCQNPRVFFVSNDTHASNVVRVVEATRNLESFAETFECSEADFMGPEFRCDMWNH